MCHQFYGKRYREVYEVMPIESFREIQGRIDNPEDFVQVRTEFVEDVLIREVDYIIDKDQSRTVIDNVLCLIERTIVKDGTVKYFTNYTFEVVQPTEEEYKNVIEKVIQQAYKHTNNNIVEFNNSKEVVR